MDDWFSVELTCFGLQMQTHAGLQQAGSCCFPARLPEPMKHMQTGLHMPSPIVKVYGTDFFCFGNLL